jgi:hypothetical protein
MLADLVRTDRHHHRPGRGDSGLAEAVKVLARGHQQLVWARQRQANILRRATGLLPGRPSCLRRRSWWAGRGRRAPTRADPELGRALPHAELVAALRCAGRRRQVEARAVGNRRLTTACHLWALRP